MTQEPVSQTVGIPKISSTPLPVNPRLLTFLFPPISESELIAFSIPIVFLILENSARLLSSLLEGLIRFDIGGVIPLAFFILIGLFMTWRLIIHSLTSKPMDIDEKKIFSDVYYIILFILTVTSIMDTIFDPLTSWFSYFERTVQIYILIRCFVIKAIMEKLAKNNRQFLYAQRITDVQITRMELIATLVTASLTYFYMRITDHNLVSTIMFTYIYTSLLISTYRNIRDRIISRFA